MKNTAFLVGQLLKASDELHYYYCKVERNGDIPNQLAGNSVYMSASETPDRAISQLRLRMAPYFAWAKRYRGLNEPKNDVSNKLIGWYLSIFEDISDKLSLVLTDTTRFNDFDKAQFFLGYLASFPKRSKLSDTDIVKPDDIDQNQEN